MNSEYKKYACEFGEFLERKMREIEDCRIPHKKLIIVVTESMKGTLKRYVCPTLRGRLRANALLGVEITTNKDITSITGREWQLYTREQYETIKLLSEILNARIKPFDANTTIGKGAENGQVET